MTTSTSSAAQNGQPSQRVLPSWASYLVPPVAASLAIVPVFRDMIAKSALQKGMPVPKITLLKGLQEGIETAPIVGGIVGTQMLLTYLTRLQNGQGITSWRQLAWGALRKARANGGFGVCYYFLTEKLNALVQKEKP
jgi:hypothetical protein